MSFTGDQLAPAGQVDPVEVLVDGRVTGMVNVIGQWGGNFSVAVGPLAAGQHSVELLNTAPSTNPGIGLGPPGTPIYSLVATGLAVAVPAAAASNPVTSTSAVLSALGADPAYPASSLTYTWSATSVPAGAAAPSFSANGTSAAQQTTVIFSQAGSYNFLVTITDPAGATTTSTVGVMVTQALITINVTPFTSITSDGITQPFAATAFDQFGQALLNQPVFTWSVASGGAGGTINTNGLYTAPATGAGSDSVQAASGGVTGSATVSITSATLALSDAGFESPAVGTGQLSYVYDPTGTAWSYSGDAGVAGNGSAFTWDNPNAPDGTQVAFLQSTGSFSQQVAGWAAGTYELTFDAAQRGYYQASRQNFQVLVDGIVVGTFIPSNTSYKQFTTAPFTVSAGTHTITFQGLDTAGGDNSVFIDAVQVVVASAAPPPVSDPGFESPSVGTGQLSYVYDPTGTAWSYSGEAGVAGNGSAFTWDNPNAPDGTQVAFLQATGSFSQQVAGWAAGTYELTFDAAQRGYYQASRQDFEVLVDGIVVGTFFPSNTSYNQFKTAPFSVSAGSHIITFQGLDSAGGDNSVFIDDVQII
jgi:hypothetical protein